MKVTGRHWQSVFWMLCSLWLVLTAPGFAEEQVGFAEHRLKVGDLERVFRVQVPPNLKPGAPVVVLLHGGSQSMRKLFAPTAMATRQWQPLARQEGFILLVPNGVNPKDGNPLGDQQSWNDFRSEGSTADDVAFIKHLLDWTQARYRTDPARVYVTGASNGGMMTQRLLIEAPERFAAGAAFISALPESDATLTPPRHPVPLMLVNGTKDPLVLWQGGPVAHSRGRTRSVEDTLAWWIRANKASPNPTDVAQLPQRDPQGECRLYRQRYPAQPGGAEVLFYKMEGGGHVYPTLRQRRPQGPLARHLLGPACREEESAPLTWNYFRRFKRE